MRREKRDEAAQIAGVPHLEGLYGDRAVRVLVRYGVTHLEASQGYLEHLTGLDSGQR